MAAEPVVTGVRSPQIAFDDQSITPFAGVTVTDPTPGAIDTVDFGVFPLGINVQDGPGYNGLMTQPFNTGAAHVGIFYRLQGTAAQVTAELDALILTPQHRHDQPNIGVSFGVTSSSGASSADYSIEIQNSAVAPNRQGVVDVQASFATIFLQPFNIAFNHRKGNNTFVFSPETEFSVIHGFRFAGQDHDTLQLSGADFGNSVAAVLRNTGDVGGSAFITDPKTGDAVRLAGVTTAELKAHPKDFGFSG